MTISNAIRHRLIDKNMSQVDLAGALGMKKQNFNNKLQRDNFTAHELYKICRALDMDIVLIADDYRYTINYDNDGK